MATIRLAAILKHREHRKRKPIRLATPARQILIKVVGAASGHAGIVRIAS